MTLIRTARLADVDALLDVQQEGSTAALALIFPQDEYPFPRAELHTRWSKEIDDPAIEAYVATEVDDAVVGFAAARGGELLHFGTAPAFWGTGLAQELHDWMLTQAIPRLAPRATYARLRVFEENHRARRFYEKLGWQHAGIRSRTHFAPYPVLVEYRHSLGHAERHRDPA